MRESNNEMDLDKLRKMILDIDKSQLLSQDITKVHRLIYQINGDSWGSSYMPIYLHINTNNIQMQLVQDLLNYLRIHKVLNTEFEEISFYFSILDILFNQLNKNEIERAVENRVHDQPCDVTEKQLLDVVERQVNLCINKKRGITKIKLISPLCHLELQETDELILLQNDKINAKIRKWSKTERSVFSSQYVNYALWGFDYKSPMNQESFVEIEYEFPEKEVISLGYEHTIAQIFVIFDLIKWGIMISSKNPYPIAEGTSISTTEDSERVLIHRRDENICGGNIVVNKKMEEMAEELINDFYDTSKEFDDIWVALRFFGRACNATIERDKLIDSVIGLEKLLVLGSGESTYKFSLHGATIFSTQWENSGISMFESENGLFESMDKLVRWFKKLYGERSTSVHGEDKKVYEYAKSSLYALAVIIKGIIYLSNKDLLFRNETPEQKKKQENKVARAVQQYVIDKAVLDQSKLLN